MHGTENWCLWRVLTGILSCSVDVGKWLRVMWKLNRRRVCPRAFGWVLDHRRDLRVTLNITLVAILLVRSSTARAGTGMVNGILYSIIHEGGRGVNVMATSRYCRCAALMMGVMSTCLLC